MTKTQPAMPFADPSADDHGSLSLIMSALEATGRLDAPAPPPYALPYGTRDNLLGLHIDAKNGGWVANVTFTNVPAGLPNCVGTPDRAPFDTPREAFLAGAATVCRIATGSPELPFFVDGDRLVCVAY